MKTRENPFATERLESLAFRFPAALTWDVLLERCAAANYCGAIVGQQGSGKSLLLGQLAPRLAERGLTPHIFRLNSDSRMAEKDGILLEARRMGSSDILLIDGGEQLSTRQWLPLRGVVDTLAGCIITVPRTGRLPTLLETETTPALLEDLVVELTGGHLPGGEIAAIHARHRRNLRECLRELRDRWAGT